MPKELKKRGRRAGKQSKQVESYDLERPNKRQKTERCPDEFKIDGDAGDDYIEFGQDSTLNNQDGQEVTFYGLLTDEEQEYYANVNNKITANDFEDESDRANFIDAVYRESASKEIKLASSQSCSRHLEKIIHLSTANQLRTLFLAFLQDINYLVQHRFGSHCVEAVFLQSAQYVEAKPQSTDDGSTSFESLFLEAVEKLQTNSGFLLTERFASHTIRVLLLVLSGQPLEDASAKDVVASRKREKINNFQQAQTLSTVVRKVPISFGKASRVFVRSAVSGLDTAYLRALATSPIGSPVLQLLVRLELASESNEKNLDEQGVVTKLIPDMGFDTESDSSKFVSSLVYDSSGAYLVQTLVRCLPGKSFKKFYKNLFKDRIGKLAKNEIASYVAVSIFERVGKDDLADAVNAIIPELSGLVERNRLAVVRSLIERCSARGVDLEPMHTEFVKIYGDNLRLTLHRMLKMEELVANQESGDEKAHKNNTADIQGSLLAQSLLKVPSLNTLVEDSLLAQTDDNLRNIAKDPIASRVIQNALTAETATPRFLRQIVPRFNSMVVDLATHSSGSHVVDALWTATCGTHFMKEKVATILRGGEAQLRDSRYGRTVWKNWSMDLYQRRHAEWVSIAKGLEKDEQPATEDSKPKKSAIKLARERYVKKQTKSPHYDTSPTVQATA